MFDTVYLRGVYSNHRPINLLLVSYRYKEGQDMYKKKVSVIVPAYNVDKYIEKCTRSILAQDYKELEIILVDDGSPDNSGAIIDKLKTEDNRIITVHQKNSGVSCARNTGLAVATGEYVTFIDGDDWVESNYISYFVKLMEESECDVVMNKNNFTERNKNFSSNDRSVVNSEKAMEWIYMGDIFVAVWNKMYKKKILDENNIVFNTDIWYGEGMLFNIEVLQYVDKVSIGEKSVYHQTFNPDSAMRKFNLESNLCGIKSLELQKKLWIKSNSNLEIAWAYHRYCFNRSIIDGLVRSDMVADNREVYEECVMNLRKNIKLPLRVEKINKKKLAWLGYYISPYMMAIRGRIKFKNAAKLAGGGIKRQINRLFEMIKMTIDAVTQYLCFHIHLYKLQGINGEAIDITGLQMWKEIA